MQRSWELRNRLAVAFYVRFSDQEHTSIVMCFPVCNAAPSADLARWLASNVVVCLLGAATHVGAESMGLSLRVEWRFLLHLFRGACRVLKAFYLLCSLHAQKS